MPGAALAPEQPHFGPLLALSNAITSGQALADICARACRIGVDWLRAMRCTLLLLDSSDQAAGRVYASYPTVAAPPVSVPLGGWELYQKRLQTGEIVEITGIANVESGGLGQLLKETKFASLLLVPVRANSRSFGCFIFAFAEEDRRFSASEKEFCHVFAAQIAIAIENARAHQILREKASQLEALRTASLAIFSQPDRTSVLRTILAQAATLLGARTCGIYEYDSGRQDLTIIAVHGDERHLGKRLGVGEGLAGTLVLDRRSQAIVPNYSEWPGRAAAFSEPGTFECVLEVLLRDVKQNIVGVLYLEAPVERDFQEQDAQLLQMFAEPAAIALVNSEIVPRFELLANVERHRTELLEKLDLARERLLTAGDGFELRRRIVELAVELVAWKCGGLYLYSPQAREFQLIVNHGLIESGAQLIIPEGAGIFGRVADDKAACMEATAEGLAQFTRNPEIAALIAIPLYRYRTLDSVVVLLDGKREAMFRETDREILVRFAARAATMLQDEELFETVQQKVNLEFLHLMSGPVNDPGQLETILYNFLTIVTANFGLKFNRALLFLLDEAKTRLTGRLAIGHFDHETWARDCEISAREKTDTLPGWLKRQGGEGIETPLGDWIKEVRIDLDEAVQQLLGSVIDSGKPRLVFSLPEPLQSKLAPAESLLAPLHDGNEVIGLLIADNKFTGLPISERDLLAVQVYCRSAAIAISNHLQYQQISSGASELEGISRVISDPKLGSLSEVELIRTLMERTQGAFHCHRIAAVIRDRHARVRQFVWPPNAALFEEQVDPLLEGASVRLLAQGGASRIISSSEQISSELHSVLLSINSPLSIALPLASETGKFGVLWLFYERNFDYQKRISALTLQRYAEQASILYVSWLRVHDLMELQRTVATLAQDFDLGKVSQAIVSEAVRVFEAECATLWPYNATERRFIADPIRHTRDDFDTAADIAPANLTESLLEAPGYTESWREDYPVSPETFGSEFLRTRQSRSFQGIGLISEEPLAALYLTYREVREFGFFERRRLKTFGNYAALFLGIARSHAHAQKAQEAAEEVGRVLVLGNLKQTLESVAQKTREAVGCPMVTLFRYDEARASISFPPVVYGDFAFPERIASEDRADSERLVPFLIQREEPTIADTPEKMEDFKSRFAREERVKSVVALPLLFGARKVGLMFASYRTQQRFRLEDIKELQLFGNQAAVAIGNAYRYEALGGLSEDLLRASRQEALKCAVAIAREQIRTNFCHLVLRDGADLRITASDAWPKDCPTAPASAVLAHAELTVRRLQPLVVQHSGATKSEPESLDSNLNQALQNSGIVSGFSVPLKHGEDIWGAIVVHHKEEKAFSPEDINFLSLVANQIIGAERSWKRHGDFARKRASWTAVYEAAKVISSRTDEEQHEIFGQILQLAINNIVDENGLPKAFFGGIQLFDAVSNSLVVECVYPPEMRQQVDRKIGERINLNSRGSSRMGVSGLVALERKAHKFSNVAAHREYIEITPETQSALVAPLLNGDELLAVINLESKNKNAFDGEDVYTLSSIAELAVIAIQRARISEKLTAESRSFTLSLATTEHEFRRQFTPIPIDISALLLNEYGELREQQREVLTRVEYLTNNQIRMIDNMTYAVQMLTGKIAKPFFRSQNLMGILKKSVDPFVHQARHSNVTIETPVNQRARLIMDLDEKLIDVVLKNLFENAIRFNRPGGFVQISVKEAEPDVIICIHDTGIGIAESERQKVFEPFCQIPRHREKQLSGLGLGLHVCRVFVELHRGTISVVNSAVDKGSTFEIRLPKRIEQ